MQAPATKDVDAVGQRQREVIRERARRDVLRHAHHERPCLDGYVSHRGDPAVAVVRSRRPPIAVGAALIAAVLAGCAGPEDAQPSSESAGPGTSTIDVAIDYWGALPEDRSTPIAFYCETGNTSAAASEDLVMSGYSTHDQLTTDSRRRSCRPHGRVGRWMDVAVGRTDDGDRRSHDLASDSITWSEFRRRTRQCLSSRPPEHSYNVS